MATHEPATTSLSGDQQNPPFVGYISSFCNDETAQLGVAAYLSVDGEGSPVEFLRTEAVSPSPLTRILYGQVLPRHAVEKAVGALLKGLGQQPKCVFVSDERLLRPTPASEIDMVLLQDIASTNSQTGLQFQEISVGGRSCRIAARDAGVGERVKELLAGIVWDPLEPFEHLRLRKESLVLEAHEKMTWLGRVLLGVGISPIRSMNVRHCEVVKSPTPSFRRGKLRRPIQAVVVRDNPAALIVAVHRFRFDFVADLPTPKTQRGRFAVPFSP